MYTYGNLAQVIIPYHLYF